MRLTRFILVIALLAGCEAAAPITPSAPGYASPTPTHAATVVPGTSAAPTPPQPGGSSPEPPMASPPATVPAGVASPSAEPAQPTMTPVGPPAEPGTLEWSRVSGDGLGLV